MRPDFSVSSQVLGKMVPAKQLALWRCCYFRSMGVEFWVPRLGHFYSLPSCGETSFDVLQTVARGEALKIL
jgi:hypothetical protein